MTAHRFLQKVQHGVVRSDFRLVGSYVFSGSDRPAIGNSAEYPQKAEANDADDRRPLPTPCGLCPLRAVVAKIGCYGRLTGYPEPDELVEHRPEGRIGFLTKRDPLFDVYGAKSRSGCSVRMSSTGADVSSSIDVGVM